MSGLSFAFARKLFEAYLVEAGYRTATIRGKLACLKILYAHLGAEGVDDLRDVRRETMIGFARYLSEKRGRAMGRPLAASTKRGVLGLTRLFLLPLRAGTYTCEPYAGNQAR